MRLKLMGLAFGAAIGFVFAWAQLSDPGVIRKMLLLVEPDVFLLMGSAIAVAAFGVRILRRVDAKAFVTGEEISWSPDPISKKVVVGSVLFGAGWSVAGTCPGPVAVMIGQGRFVGVAVLVGLLGGVFLQSVVMRALDARREPRPNATELGAVSEAV